jgi:hypothetical protein
MKTLIEIYHPFHSVASPEKRLVFLTETEADYMQIIYNHNITVANPPENHIRIFLSSSARLICYFVAPLRHFALQRRRGKC